MMKTVLCAHCEYVPDSDKDLMNHALQFHTDKIRRFVSRKSTVEPPPAEPPTLITNRMAHEEAAGYGLCDEFFRLNGINPDAKYDPCLDKSHPGCLDCLVEPRDDDPHDEDCPCYGDFDSEGNRVIHDESCGNCTCEAGPRPSASAPSDDRVEFPSGGPCSACGDGDTEQKYHKHVAPDPSGKPYPKPTDAEVEMARAWIKARGRYLYDAQNWEELGKNYVWNVSYLLAGYHKALTESSPVDLQDAAFRWAQANRDKYAFTFRWHPVDSERWNELAEVLAAFYLHMREGK